MRAENQRVAEEHRRPLIVPTGRGAEHFQHIRATLATLRLEEDLVAFLLREANDLVLE